MPVYEDQIQELQTRAIGDRINWDRLIALLPYILQLISLITGKPIALPAPSVSALQAEWYAYVLWLLSHATIARTLADEFPDALAEAITLEEKADLAIWVLQTVKPALHDFPGEAAPLP